MIKIQRQEGDLILGQQSQSDPKQTVNPFGKERVIDPIDHLQWEFISKQGEEPLGGIHVGSNALFIKMSVNVRQVILQEAIQLIESKDQ